jgi:hypothetical protein
MIFILNYKVDIVDVFTLSISIIALIATLRKKEFGKLYFIPKSNENEDLWIQVIKSDLYDVKITCEPYKNMSGRIKILKENSETETVLAFPKETKPTVEIAILKVNTILKFRGCNSSRIQIQYKDKYNNCYSQEMTQNDIGKRRHRNIWNLTFVGS